MSDKPKASAVLYQLRASRRTGECLIVERKAADRHWTIRFGRAVLLQSDSIDEIMKRLIYEGEVVMDVTQVEHDGGIEYLRGKTSTILERELFDVAPGSTSPCSLRKTN